AREQAVGAARAREPAAGVKARRRWRAAWLALGAFGALGGGEGVAQAQGLKLDVHPALGPEGVSSEGWTALRVRLEHGGPGPLKGVVRVTPEMGYRSGLTPARSEAPFSLAPGSPAVVSLPVQGSGSLSLDVVVLDAQGAPLASSTVRTGSRPEPLLVDMNQPSRLLGTLRGARLSVRYSPGYGRGAPKPSLQVASPWVDPKTGEASLPTRAAEYGDATALLLPSDVLARLVGPELEALGGFVQGGGTLAVAIKRPEDLRSATLRALVGGEARKGETARRLSDSPSLPIENDPSASPSEPEDEDADEAPKPHGGGGSAPVPKRPMVRPGDAVVTALASYEGGNLAASDYGSAAPYGLGEVHLLAFDPSEPSAAADPWVQARLVDLVRHAHDRRATLFVGRSAGVLERYEVTEVRRQLDPNEGSRWAVLVAAVLLVVYAGLAGPLNFALASRAGKPLRALRHLAIASALTFGAIVLLGTIAKGVRGRSQRLSLVEASGGMGRGVVRRYRGFFTPRARALRVDASDAGAVVSMAGESNDRATLRVDRGGLALENVLTLPWQTVIVREEGLMELHGGLTLAREGGDVRVVNRLGRDLTALVVSVPGRGRFLLPSLRDGASALATEGRALSGHVASASTAGAIAIHGHGFESIRDELDKASPGLSAAWLALAATAREKPLDWWPEDVPVAIGQLVGGEGVLHDAGLRVGADRCLVRVLGYGGEP
ncbi:MAG: hypothetical protein MUF34_22745, partial [Polyangiaceae bacterium]|nr:hypothetical protein [Polyangiaceae bacterium]